MSAIIKNGLWLVFLSTYRIQADFNLTTERVGNIMYKNGGDLICQRCSCPDDHGLNPYTVNCQAQQLGKMPRWDAMFMIRDQLRNVYINFDFNDLEIVEVIAASPVLDALSLTNNRIYHVVPEAFIHLPHLKFLSLRANNLSKLHADSFKAPKGFSMSLEVLDLSYNSLSSLDADLFDDVPNLYELHLGFNPLLVIDAATAVALNNLHELKKLSLTQTQIKVLPDTLVTPIKTLEYLLINGNNIEVVPKVLEYASNLIELNLDDNPIEILSHDSFQGLVNLKMLNVSNLPKLTEIKENTFSNMVSLEILYACHNPQLTKINSCAFRTGFFTKLKQLKEVYLNDNNLSVLSSMTLGWLNLQVLDLQDNPWLCDCRLLWVKHMQIDPYFFIRFRCNSPESVNGRNFMQIDDTRMCSPSSLQNINEIHNYQEKQTKKPEFNLTASIIQMTVLSIVTIVCIFSVTSAVFIVYKKIQQEKMSNRARIRYIKAEMNEGYMPTVY